ncbi:MAG: DHHA1 domain-containing protein, partial [Candidatus Gracilibacteria bacterium]|nr:DHHA1 domain-containing protein [Candidatus Gracilibacteria bacterium]
KDWHVGILGLVASRIAEKYNRPAIIMQDIGDTLVASARSPKFFNITEALTEFGELFISFGGHAQAAGFNIKKENLEEFKKLMEDYAEKKLKDLELRPVLEIDCEIGEGDMNFEFLKNLESLEPFGIGNEKPIFLLKNISPYFVGQVGKEKNHLKFIVKTDGGDIHVIGFQMGNFAEDLKKEGKVDIVCNLEKNLWNNKEYVQLRAIDLREADGNLGLSFPSATY